MSKQTHAKAIDDSSPLNNLTKVLDFLGQNSPSVTEFSSISELWDWAVQHWDIEKIPQQKNISLSE